MPTHRQPARRRLTGNPEGPEPQDGMRREMERRELPSRKPMPTRLTPIV